MGSVLVSILALPTLSEGIEGWGRWISVVVGWIQEHQLLMTWISGFGAGALFIVGIAALSVWWEDAGRPKPLYTLRGVWKYVRVAAIGKVRVRYASYDEGHRERAIWLDRRIGKGKIEHVPFEVFPSLHPPRLGIDIPAIYRLVFSSEEEIDWTETFKEGRRRYEGTPHPLQEGESHTLFVGVQIGIQLGGGSGWPLVRRVFGRRPRSYCRIARMGWFVATPPGHPAAERRRKDLHVRLPTDERLPPKPDMPDLSPSDRDDS